MPWEEFKHRGWRFVTNSVENPSKTAECDALEKTFDLNPGEHLPEMLWLANQCVLSNDRVKLTFNARNLLLGSLKGTFLCDEVLDPLHINCLCPLEPEEDNTMQLPFARSWKEEAQNKRPDAEVITCKKSWVHLSGHKGLLEPTSLGVRLSCKDLSESGSLPVDLLKDTSLPILHFAQLPLVEDDLADCGVMTADLKLRVMPSFFFLALTQLIRLDGSVQRKRITRIFHQFGSTCMLRETTVEDDEHIIHDVSKQDKAEGHRIGNRKLSKRKIEQLEWD
eukprot:Blabericola_migrator_1__5220@NODE_268_length_10573_cov_173_829050_g224_i0_p6_GENE_NODE_268_length_10573_cov_173_829050_g224_i0NODE_268_length_10573_cov_173_829050_g224_i0_p6_ORF_typecomplete_len279_score41_93TIP41/PF04176_13/4_5e26_NODE_268_length_10573_cov_173_829050_g224_i080388874